MLEVSPAPGKIVGKFLVFDTRLPGCGFSAFGIN